MYKFTLEALLNHRRHQEEACQKELAQACRIFTDVREKLDQIKKEKLKNLEKLQLLKDQSKNVTDILIYMNYIQQLSKDIEGQTSLVHESGKLVDQKRQTLISMMQKHKTLERLKQKEMQVYQKKVTQNEGKLMDEVASGRHAKKI
jgi:flagellar protein FliJ